MQISPQQLAGVLQSDSIFQRRNDLMIFLIENLQSIVWPYWKYPQQIPELNQQQLSGGGGLTSPLTCFAYGNEKTGRTGEIDFSYCWHKWLCGYCRA